MLAMDDMKDASDNEPEPVLLPIEPVEIVPFLNFDNLEPLMPEEVQPEDLLVFLYNPGNGPKNIHQENIQIGFAHILQAAVDPVFNSWAPLFKPSPEAIRQWVRHFSQGSNSMPTITIPNAWMNFFIYLLLQSPSFDWAKDFL